MTQKWPKRKDSLYSRCFHAVFAKVHESHKSGVPPAAGASRPRIRRWRDARDDSRDGCPTTAPSPFMVPMRAYFGVGAFHEPGHWSAAVCAAPAAARREHPERCGWVFDHSRAPRDPPRFMVPMHAKKKRKEALHEPDRGAPGLVQGEARARAELELGA